MNSPSFALGWIDYAIIGVYFVGVMAHGIVISRKMTDSESYFLAGRNLPWFLIGFSLYATNMSGASFIGLMGASYDNGIAVFNYEWSASLILIILAFFILPHFLRTGLYTVPEFLEARFDRRSRTAYAAFTVLAIILIDSAGALYAGGIVLSALFEPLSLGAAVWILALVAGLYTVLGGLHAVVVTDAVQAILLILGAALVFVVGLDQIGGWDALTAQVHPDKLDLIQPPDDAFLPWPGLGTVFLLGFYYWSFNQFVTQRTLAARTLDQGRKGAIFAGFLKLPNLFLMILPGLIAIELYPALGNPDLAFPTLVFDLLPIGLRGLVLTALVAAMMSSLDSALNAVGSLVTMDFVRPLRPHMSAVHLMKSGPSCSGWRSARRCSSSRR